MSSRESSSLTRESLARMIDRATDILCTLRASAHALEAERARRHLALAIQELERLYEKRATSGGFVE